MKQVISFFLCLLMLSPCFAQEEKKDSARVMDEVIIRSFEQNKSLRSAASTVQILKLKNFEDGSKISFVNVLNSAPGIRIEERSPGSYRINIRGSSLRSPFGVRNVKIYWNDIPVTDPGGNSYFNQFAWNNISSIEIFKGPAGSMYGAGTGGLILMNPIGSWEPGINAEYSRGSYNLNNVFVTTRFGLKENKNQFTYAHNSSDGYRAQSKMSRDNITWTSQLKLNDRQQFSASVLYSDVYYQTPGALTLAEYNSDPKQARPAAGGLPSAVDARAAIKQTNFLVGFSHYYKMNANLTNQTTFYGSFAEIDNPAIRNYERRTEPGFGGRTLFIFKNKEVQPDWQIVAGGEFQHGFFNTIVFKNQSGKPDTMQTNDDIFYTLNSYFVQGDATIKQSWYLTAGASVNRSKLSFSRINQFPIITRTRYYKDEVAPRIVVKKVFSDDLFISTSIARGFSPPTIGELLPSTSIFSSELEAEYGWNYEMNLHYSLFDKKLKLDATGFYFKLNKALVQRRDSSGADYFVNAGDVKEKGLEFMASYTGICKNSILSRYDLNAAFTVNHFRYGSFARGSTDFSGKTVPSVPSNTFSLLADLHFIKGWNAGFSYYSAGKIFLHDANTASASAYHLLSVHGAWKKNIKGKFVLKLFAGADNLLDEKYSLGNDINAAAGRFYNAAAPRNYYAGLGFQWISPKQ